MSDTDNNTTTIKTKRLHICGTIVILILFVVILLLWFGIKRGPSLSNEMRCLLNLSDLARAMLIYADENDDKYPAAERWNDLLVLGNHVNQERFRCPGNKKERCSYAVNPNAEIDSSPDMVLIFEIKGGWNKFGGPELITAENHNGKGCNVLFNDGHIEFVPAGRFGELMWKVEEGDSVREGVSK
jgi:prepilin-type processing-associated H-X9-DG protein